MSGGQSTWLLQAPKTDQDWEIWGWHHRLSHDAIRKAVSEQKSITLADYVIYPIDLKSVTGFLESNSQLHRDMNSALNLADQDLQDVDLKDERQRLAWVFLHWQAHNTAEQALNI